MLRKLIYCVVALVLCRPSVRGRNRRCTSTISTHLMYTMIQIPIPTALPGLSGMTLSAGTPGETVDDLSASQDRPGQLYIASTNAVWAEPWDPLGPFLFKVVKGDFIATVIVTDYAGTISDARSFPTMVV